jgi:hypothetical protein
MRWGLGVALLLAWLVLPGTGRAQLGGPIQVMTASTTEQWIWQRLRAGETADLNTRCGVTLDPRANDDARWRDPCRQVSARFLEWLLTGPDWRVAPAHRGVRMVGARVADPIDLTATDVRAEVWLIQGRFEREVWLDRARFAGLLSLGGSVFRAGLSGNALQVGGSLFLRDGAVVTGGVVNLIRADIAVNLDMDNARFEAGINASALKLGGSLFLSNGAVVTGGAVNLVSASIAGNLDMANARFEAGIIAAALKVGGSLFLRDGAVVTGGVVNLVRANIAGNLDMANARFEAGIIANSLKLGGSLFLRNGAVVTGGLVNLGSASIEGQLDMANARFETGINADSLKLGGALFLRNGAVVTGGEANLVRANIAGNLDMANARFEAGIIADSLKLGGNLFLFDSTFAQPPRFIAAEIGRGIDLTGATLPGLNLSGSVVNGDLRLSRGDGNLPTWTAGGALVLRNTHVLSIEDAAGAWPDQLDLKGFTYARLGGSLSTGAVDMLRRPAEHYVAWLARDPVLSRQPYEQLASVFRATGDRDRADAILTAYRDRERAGAWRDGKCWNSEKPWWQRPLAWTNENCRNALWLGLLWATIGYGIGDGPFRILYWVLGVTLLGMLVLAFARPDPARPRGVLWCFGASLDHLLPIVDLNREFSDYFHDPERTRLRGWQLSYFALHALVGYALGFFLLAGLTGLTQGQ